MYCIHCGREIADDSRFCAFCGSAVERMESAPTPATDVPGFDVASAPVSEAATGFGMASPKDVAATPVVPLGTAPASPRPLDTTSPSQQSVDMTPPWQHSAGTTSPWQQPMDTPPASACPQTVREPVPPWQQPADMPPANTTPPWQRPTDMTSPWQQPAGTTPPWQQPAGTTSPWQQPAGTTPPWQRPAGTTPPWQRPASTKRPWQQAVEPESAWQPAQPGEANPFGPAENRPPSEQSGAGAVSEPTDANATAASQPTDVPPTPAKKRRKWPVVLACLLLFVAVAGFVAYQTDLLYDALGIEKPEEDYKADCEVVRYEELSENFGDYTGEEITVTGEVTDMKVSENTVTLLMDTYFDPDSDIYYGGTVVVTYDKREIDTEIKVADELTVYGSAAEKKADYTTNKGAYHVPAIGAKYIER